MRRTATLFCVQPKNHCSTQGRGEIPGPFSLFARESRTLLYTDSMSYEQCIVTRNELASFLKSLGVVKGCTVLLQADLSDLPVLVGMETSLLETILNLIGPSGCLILPTFTRSALDPSCLMDQSIPAFIPYSAWQLVREQHPGYTSRTLPADQWAPAANTFLLQTKVKRTEHPCYSFAWSDPAPFKTTLDSLDYPVSYTHILKMMKNPSAINLLFGVPLLDSLMLKMEARERNMDTTVVKTAFLRRVRRSFLETFLDSEITQETAEEISGQLDVMQTQFEGLPVFRISRPVDAQELALAASWTSEEETN